MIGQIVSTGLAGPLVIRSILPLGDKGGQGKVYQTDNPRYLIKVWEPFEEPSDYQIALKDTGRRYRTFSRLRFSAESELTCLPLESVEVQGRPAYVMQHAEGKEMAEEWSMLGRLSFRQRLQIAQNIASGISVLHSHGVVHADIKRDNFFFDPHTCGIRVLDIDGGGYWGREPQTEHFRPSVVPLQRYMAPELHHNGFSWNGIWEDKNRRMQPDLWSVAILIYDIIVLSSEGPFPTSLFGRKGGFLDHPDWPLEEQRQSLQRLGMDSEVLGLFTETFCGANRTREDFRRPTAAHWSTVLGRAIRRGQPGSIKCSVCRNPITDLSNIICPRCAGLNRTVPIWDYATCPRGHKTPAKSPYLSSQVYCMHRNCGLAVYQL